MHCFFTIGGMFRHSSIVAFQEIPLGSGGKCQESKRPPLIASQSYFSHVRGKKKLIQTCSPFCGGLRTERSRGIFSFSVGGGTHQSDGGDGGGGGGANEGTPPSPGGEEETDGRTDEGGKTFCARPPLPFLPGNRLSARQIAARDSCFFQQ